MLRPRKREGDTDDRGTSGRPRQLLLQLLLLVPVLNGFSPSPSRCFVRPLRRCGLELARSDLSELVSDAGVEMDEGNLERAEALLIEARASDPHRDMPRSLHNAFCRLFNEHAAAHPTETWPLEGLAALCTDSEDWDDLLEACRKAQRRGTLSVSSLGSSAARCDDTILPASRRPPLLATIWLTCPLFCTTAHE